MAIENNKPNISATDNLNNFKQSEIRKNIEKLGIKKEVSVLRNAEIFLHTYINQIQSALKKD